MLLTIFIENGLIKGYARSSQLGVAKIFIDINEQMHATVITKTAISQLLREEYKLGKEGSYCSFTLPLPQQLFDGAPYRIQARLGNEGDRNKDQAKACCVFQKGDRHGIVDSVDGYFQGWVAFSNRPSPLPYLAVHDEAGALFKTVA